MERNMTPSSLVARFCKIKCLVLETVSVTLVILPYMSSTKAQVCVVLCHHFFHFISDNDAKNMWSLCGPSKPELLCINLIYIYFLSFSPLKSLKNGKDNVLLYCSLDPTGQRTWQVGCTMRSTQCNPLQLTYVTASEKTSPPFYQILPTKKKAVHGGKRECLGWGYCG